jgi:hypothetical protein
MVQTVLGLTGFSTNSNPVNRLIFKILFKINIPVWHWYVYFARKMANIFPTGFELIT